MSSKYYYDPNHGGCLRIFTNVGDNISFIKGAYGNDENPKGYWFAEVTHVKKNTYNGKPYNLIVNFKHKIGLTHKTKLHAYMINREIKWEDGNVWKQLYA